MQTIFIITDFEARYVNIEKSLSKIFLHFVQWQNVQINVISTLVYVIHIIGVTKSDTIATCYFYNYLFSSRLISLNLSSFVSKMSLLL